jgi:hypothetical protein
MKDQLRQPPNNNLFKIKKILTFEYAAALSKGYKTLFT